MSKTTIYPSIPSVIANAEIPYGARVQVKGDDGKPQEYTKHPVDNPQALFGERFAGVNGKGEECFYAKHARVSVGATLLTGGDPDFSPQDAADAAANACLKTWCEVTGDTGGIFLGTEEINARAFHVKGQEKQGWVYFKGFAGIGRDWGRGGAPYLKLEMLNPRGHRSPKVDPKTGFKIGTEKRTKTIVVGLESLTPDQQIPGCSALLNPDGEANFTTGSRNARAVAKENKRRAARSGKAEAVSGVVEPYSAHERDDGSWVVTFNPAAGVQHSNWTDKEFTGPQAWKDAEGFARMWNNRVRGS